MPSHAHSDYLEAGQVLGIGVEDERDRDGAAGPGKWALPEHDAVAADSEAPGCHVEACEEPDDATERSDDGADVKDNAPGADGSAHHRTGHDVAR